MRKYLACPLPLVLRPMSYVLSPSSFPHVLSHYSFLLNFAPQADLFIVRPGFRFNRTNKRMELTGLPISFKVVRVLLQLNYYS